LKIKAYHFAAFKRTSLFYLIFFVQATQFIVKQQFFFIFQLRFNLIISEIKYLFLLFNVKAPTDLSAMAVK
jgi:hypothetical protein